MSESCFFWSLPLFYWETPFRLVSEGRSNSNVDGSSYTTVYPCSCQPRGGCDGQVKVVAEIGKVYDNGVVCQKTSVRVCHD